MTTDFFLLRARAQNYLVGNRPPDAWIQKLDKEAAALLPFLNPRMEQDHPAVFKPLIAIPGFSLDAYHATAHLCDTYQRLLQLATACATQDSLFYHDTALIKKILTAYDLLYETSYHEHIQPYGNWWHWEIGIPQAFLSGVLLLYPYCNRTQIKHYTDAVLRFAPVCDVPSPQMKFPVMSAANLVDKAMSIALMALLREDTTQLVHVHSALHTVLHTVTTGDGFYADGSYIQHEALPYIGGYGCDLYARFSFFLWVLQDTPWAISYPDNAQQLLFDFIETGIEPFLFEGHLMDRVSGRSITRAGTDDLQRGARLLSALIPLVETMPNGKQKTHLQEILSYHLSFVQSIYYAMCMSPMAATCALKLPPANNTTAPQCKTFGGMDIVVSHNRNYALLIAMHSSRIFAHELINNEGRRTWHTADGAISLYLPGSHAYGGGYWATVDPVLLCGTTVERCDLPLGAGDRQKNRSPLVGAAVTQHYASVGMEYHALTKDGTHQGAHVQKSYFLFPEGILCLGTGITSKTGEPVCTIIENRRLETQQQCITKTEHSVHLQDGVVSIGYVFLDTPHLECTTQTRTDNWLSQGDFAQEETNTFFTLIQSHGTSPHNASYAYWMLPNATACATQNWRKHPCAKVLANETAVQAVCTNEMFLAQFWAPTQTPRFGITTDTAVSLIVKETKTHLHITLTELSQTKPQVNLSIKGKPFCIDTKDKYGTPVSVSLKK